MDETWQKNKIKWVLNQTKQLYEKTKNNIFNVFSNTKEKIKNTINKLTEKIKKIQKKTNNELNEVFAQWTDQWQNKIEQWQQEDTEQSKSEQVDEKEDEDEDEKEEAEKNKGDKNEKDEQIKEEIEQWIWNNLKELLNWYFSMLEHLWEIDYLINNIDYYNEILSEMIKFSETSFMEETVWRVSDNGQFKEYCSAHLRNLLTPFKTIISLIEDLSTGKINEDKFKSLTYNLNTNFEDNKREFLEFCDFLNDKDADREWIWNTEVINDNDKKESDDITNIDFFEWNLDNSTKQTIISQILEKESKKDYYARWSEWIIFKIEIKDENWENKEYLVAKKRFDGNTQREFNIHHDVQSLMPIWDDTVRVPELKARISWLNWENYIIMDFIKWKTIYQSIVEEILRKRGLWTINFKNDSEASTCLCKLLWIETNTEENLNRVDKEYYRLSEDIKLFDSKTWKKYRTALKKFLDTIHENWIYHRDLHEKNIIIWDDWKIYIIDFGKSIKIDDKNTQISKEDIYTEQIWEQIWKYDADEIWISMIKKFTKSEEDEENEERVKKHIKKEKELTNKINSWDSIIKQFNELPKWFRIKMERNQFLKEVEKESKSSKRISLNTFLDSKWDELMIYLFAQSLENIENTLKEISERTKTCENEINRQEKDPRAEQPLFRKKYITPHEKKLKWMSSLKNKLEKLKKCIKNPDNK